MVHIESRRPVHRPTISDVKLGKDFNPGRARWCEEHNRLECSALKSKSRTHCHAPAIRGTKSCKIHGGTTRAVALAKGEALITAWSAVGDAAKTIDHKMAVLGVLQMTWLRLAAYSDLLRKQVATQGAVIEPDADGGYSAPEHPVDNAGLIGHRYGAAGKDGHIYAQNEEIRSLVRLEAEERDRVVKYAKVAHDMGISDRLTSLAERWGDVVANRVTVILEGLDLTPEQQAKVPDLIVQHLSAIEITESDKAAA